MITYFDLVSNEEFRDFVERRLATTQQNSPYLFSSYIPKLYKYRALSEYAVTDIINGQLTATNIGSFNDLFDGAMHRYGTDDERKNKAKEKWDQLKQLQLEAGITDNLISREEYIGLYTDYYKTDSRLKFRMLEYLGTYVSCLSARYDSTLMWTHYAVSSTGICTEYDFNQCSINSIQRNLIFPVAYSKTPVQINDLLDDEKGEVFPYSLDAAVLCSALNKSDVWSYENEWRLILVLAFTSKQQQRIPLLVDKPISITFGFHFLKPFFYYEFNNINEIRAAEQRLENLFRLLDYMNEHDIKPFIAVPAVGEYKLVRKFIELQELKSFINESFYNGNAENIRYYYVYHDRLMDLLNI